MKVVNFDKQGIIDELVTIKNEYQEEYYETQSYDVRDEDGPTLTKEEHEARVQKAIDFVTELSEERVLDSVGGMSLKKNGKPRKNAIAHIFVLDVGHWFVEWYTTYATHRIVTRALSEDELEVKLESTNINAGEYPCVVNI